MNNQYWNPREQNIMDFLYCNDFHQFIISHHELIMIAIIRTII